MPPAGKVQVTNGSTLPKRLSAVVWQETMSALLPIVPKQPFKMENTLYGALLVTHVTLHEQLTFTNESRGLGRKETSAAKSQNFQNLATPCGQLGRQ